MVDSPGVGHCKDAAHVRVLALQGAPASVGEFGAVYVAQTTCVNVPGYDGWVVQLTHALPPHPERPGLRLLPPLAEVFPAWLQRAAHRAAQVGGTVNIEHTDDKNWTTYAALAPVDARALALDVLFALEQSPPGRNG